MSKRIVTISILATIGIIVFGSLQRSSLLAKESIMLADTTPAKPASTPTTTPATVPEIKTPVTIEKTEISKWMSWEGGVDFAGSTVEGATEPNIIVHVARMVHTPVGSAPSGMIVYQPNPKKPPVFMGFVSTNSTVGKYFGGNIFAGTPFEKAPKILASQISIDASNSKDKVSSKIKIPGYVIETQLSGIESVEKIDRAMGSPMPFAQQGLEATATKVSLKINGKSVKVHLLPQGIGGGASAVWSPTGMYAR
jgi:hypothetical protein